MLNNTNKTWLNEFRQKHKRNPKALFIGNIANNAYNCANLLNNANMTCDVLCYDYYHVMGCPEWEQADIDLSTIDQNKPDFTTVNLKGFERPRWFAQGPLPLTLSYLIARNQSQKVKAEKLWKQLQAECGLTGRSPTLSLNLWASLRMCRAQLVTINGKLINRLRLEATTAREAANKLWNAAKDKCLIAYRQFGFKPIFGLKIKCRIEQAARNVIYCLKLVKAKLLLAVKAPHYEQHELYSQIQATLIQDFARRFPKRQDKLSIGDLKPYSHYLDKWTSLFTHYDVVFGFSIDGIYPLLAGKRPYVAFEHGTIRDIPFQNDSLGRIASLVYSEADVVYLTNADSMNHAAILVAKKTVCGLHGFSLPTASIASGKTTHPQEELLRADCQSKIVFLCPARQHWRDGFPSWLKGNDRIIKAVAKLSDSYSGSFHLFLIEWGSEVQLTKSLIAELKLEDYFTWLQPMPKRQLIEAYNNADCVIDQFVLPCIGSVTLDAVAMGVPVITALDDKAMSAFYGEKLPLLKAFTIAEIAAAMQYVIENRDNARKMAKRSQEWFQRFHSTATLNNKLIEATRLALGAP